MASKYRIIDRHVENLSELSHDLGSMMLRGMISRTQYGACLANITPHLPRHVIIEMRTPKGVMRVTLGGNEPIHFTLSPRAKRID